MGKNKKSLLRRSKIVLRYNNRSGFLKYFLNNAMYVLLVILLFLFLLLVVNYYFDIDSISEWIIAHFPNGIVLLLFYISESIFGLIPPDIFILWVKGFPQPMLMVGVLSVLSYLGGITGLLIGKSVRKIKPIRIKLEQRFGDYMVKIKRWGSVFIVTSALLPLPYSTICMLAGILNYPLPRLLYYGLFRIIRFFLYAIVLYGVL